MDGQIDGWMDGRMDGWMDGWIDRQIDRQIDSQLALIQIIWQPSKAELHEFTNTIDTKLKI